MEGYQNLILSPEYIELQNLWQDHPLLSSVKQVKLFLRIIKRHDIILNTMRELDTYETDGGHLSNCWEFKVDETVIMTVHVVVTAVNFGGVYI